MQHKNMSTVPNVSRPATSNFENRSTETFDDEDEVSK